MAEVYLCIGLIYYYSLKSSFVRNSLLGKKIYLYIIRIFIIYKYIL